MPFFVTIGFDLNTGKPLEVFGGATKKGSDFDVLLSDACVVVSLALQHGVDPEEMRKSLSKTPAPGVLEMVDEPASIVGWIVEALIQEKNG